MKFIELRQAANQVTSGQVGQVLHKMLDAFQQLGLDRMLDDGVTFIADDSDVVADAEAEELSQLMAENDLVQQIGYTEDEELRTQPFESENDYVESRLPEDTKGSGDDDAGSIEAE